METAATIELVSQLLLKAANLFSVGIEAVNSANSAMAVLKKAQDEKWVDGGPEWADAFKTADAALQAAFDRLK